MDSNKKQIRQTHLGQYFQRIKKDRLHVVNQSNNSYNNGGKYIDNDEDKISKKSANKIQKNNKGKQTKQEKKQARKEKQEESDKNQEKEIELSVNGSESSSISIPSSLKQRQLSKPKQTQMVNVKFYSNKIPSAPNGDLIDNIHKKWWGNYSLLEAHHGFIQWIFPNAFQSRFNMLAKPLTQQQAQQFRNNQEIAKRYVNSYIMMLQFYGIKLKDKYTGQLTRSRKPKYEERYYKTFLTSFHNHMRITRILSSLVMCGFGRYARQFSIFLGDEINKSGGYLSALKKYGVYERQWKQYSQYVEKQSQMSAYLKYLKKN